MNLAGKYRPKTFSDMTEQSVICEILENISNQDEIDCRNFLFIGSQGVGKAQPLYSKILTPKGFVQMKDIHVGDRVFTAKGNIAKVSGIYPQGVRPIYEIKLQDKTKIRVSDEHLNCVYTYDYHKKQRKDMVLTTVDLIELFNKKKDGRLRIDVPSVDWPEVKLPMNPYLVGALIGDGSLSNNMQFSNSEQDVVSKVDEILRNEWNLKLKKLPGDNVDYDISSVDDHTWKYRYDYLDNKNLSYDELLVKLVNDGYPRYAQESIVNIFNDSVKSSILREHPELKNNIKIYVNESYDKKDLKFFQDVLDSLKLLCKSVDKHIPEMYLNTSREQRLELLRGLYDTDGYTGKDGSTTYTTCSDELSKQFEYLVRSLGIRDTVVHYPAKYKVNGEMKYTGSTVHDHFMKVPNDMIYCSSIKHLARRKKRQCDPLRNIISIEYIGQEECQCIMVDHEDHTYISDDFIPTHNTTCARALALKLNNGNGEPIELDAASHGGVDDIRQLVQQMKTYPVNCKWKVFIIDECFPGNSWVSTPSGKVQIKDIHEGDRIYNLTGEATVTHLFHNTVKSENLACIRVGGRNIITTKDHLFFTDSGWVKAIDLKQGDQLYDYKTLQNLQQGVQRKLSKRCSSVLQQKMQRLEPSIEDESIPYLQISKNISRMWKDIVKSDKFESNFELRRIWTSLRKAEIEFGIEVGATFKTLAYVYVSGMWKADGDTKQRSSKSMLASMRHEDSFTTSKKESGCDKEMHMVWKFIYSELFGPKSKDMQQGLQNSTDNISLYWKAKFESFCSNEGEQPNVESSNCCKNGRYKREERNIARSACDSWWQRSIYSASDSFERSIGTPVEIRISCEDTSKENQFGSLSNQLQVRPSVSRIKNRDRGGWSRPQYEISTIVRREESEMSEQFRVGSVEVYKQGYNDELFSGSFSSEELHSGYVKMYDLEIGGHPSYIVNDVLVHNCHALSPQSWQSLLLVLESNPARSIVCLCTTNPEKIPATILSRVQVFQLSKISTKGIHDRLVHVIECENKEGRNISFDDDAIEYIAKLASGGMRDALTLLDKALCFSTNITLENISKSLNIPNYSDFFDLLSAYAQKDNVKISDIIDKVYNSGINFVKWFQDFHSFVMNVVKYIFLQDISKTMIPKYYEDKISKYTSAHAYICLKLGNKLISMNDELRKSSYQQEVALTYLCSINKKG